MIVSDDKGKKTTARDRGEWQGMNWIRQSTRLAIYLRDGMACCYCGASVEQGAALSLDHVKPHSKGGGNEATNLVTCCSRCNSSRADRPMRTFARAVAGYINHGVTGEQIVAHVNACRRRSMTGPRQEARQLIERRGSAAKAMAAMSR
jgi:hypothetical protein